MLLENYENFELAKKIGFSYYDKDNNRWDSDSTLEIGRKTLVNGEFPFPIGSINGELIARHIKMTSLRNLPVYVLKGMQLINFKTSSNLRDLPTESVARTLTISRTTLTSLESNLKRVTNLHLKNIKKLKSLKGIEKVDCLNVEINDCKDLENLNHLPSNLKMLTIIDCDITNLKGLNTIKEVYGITITRCNELTSLEGVPNSVRKIKIIDCENIPEVLKDFAVHVQLHGFKNYYLDLLRFIVKAKRESDMNDIDWPSDIKKDMPELIRSFAGIEKFNI